MEIILETNNLEKKYKGFRALNNTNIHIEKGAIYGLIGKNGAGKTTLIRIICGLQEPTNGSYIIYGKSNNSNDIISARKRMGAIIETPSIYGEMTARDNLTLQYKLVGMPSLDVITIFSGIYPVSSIYSSLLNCFLSHSALSIIKLLQSNV